MPSHTLSVVPTPLGHLGDITLRALETLKHADAILAEDTRVTRKLCTHYGITTPLRSHHAFSEASQLPRLLADLHAGAHYALVSDAGTPGISDPGARLIAAVQADPALHLDILPGPTALITALLASGFAGAPFQFLGFVPRHKADQQALWNQLKTAPVVTILYESPQRLRATVRAAADALEPEREGAIAKELTKIHELVSRGPLLTLGQDWPEDAWRGECVLLIGPAGAVPPDDDRARELARLCLEAGLTPRTARTMLAVAAQVSPSRAYTLLREAHTDATTEPR